MNFRPCTSNCTKDGTHCKGCGRSHEEVQSMSAIGKQLLAHLDKYDYDDPETFLDIICDKALLRLDKLRSEKSK